MRNPVTLPKSTRWVARSLVSMSSQSNTASASTSVGAPVEMTSSQFAKREKRSSGGSPVWPEKADGHRLLCGRQRVQREACHWPTKASLRGFSRLRQTSTIGGVVGDRTGGDHGRAAPPGGAVGGDDMHGARQNALIASR